MVGSIEYSQTWKESATPAGRRFWAHTAVGRRISDSGSTGAPPFPWNTPRATDGSNGGPNQANGALCFDVNLAAFPVEGWPKTPAACDGVGGTFDVMKAIRENLNPKAKLRDWALVAGWATAAATTWGGSPEAHLERKRKAIEAGAKMGLVVSCLDQQAMMAGWPTTNAANVKGAYENPELLKARKDSIHQNNLQDAVQFVDRGLTFVWFPVPTGRRVVLAPEFSLWLMGFPEAWVAAAPGARDWLEAQAALASECSREQETP